MASDESWNLEGLSPELQETARNAARRRGVSVQDWLRIAVAEHLASGAQPARAGASDEGDGSDRLGELSRAIDARSVRAPVAGGPGGADVALALRAIEERLAALGAGRGSMTPPSPSERELDHQHELDDAVAEIAARQRLLDADDAPSIDGPEPDDWQPGPAPFPSSSPLQGHLQALTDELRMLREPGGLHDVLSTLRAQLTGIGQRLSAAAPRQSLGALDAQVQQLSERIDDGRRQGLDETAAAPIAAALDDIRMAIAALAPAESLAEFRAEVQSLDRKIDALASGPPASPAPQSGLDDLRAAIDDLQEVARHAATGAALAALAAEVRHIRDRVDRITAPESGSGADLPALMDQRFRDLEERLGAAPASPGSAGRLEATVERLAERLATTDLGTDTPALAAMASSITQITDRLEGADSKLSALGSIEQSVRELLDRMDALKVHSPAGGGEVVALRGDIDGLRRTHEASERQIGAALHAVQGTLDRIADRFEPPAGSASAASVAAQDDVPYSGLRPAEPRPGPPARSGEVPDGDEASRETDTGPADRRPGGPRLPADHPLEPGSGMVPPRAASAAERIAASEAALGGARPASTDNNPKANFIAAARRAAQAAANMAPPAEPPAEAGGPANSLFASLARRLSGRKTLALALVLLAGAAGLHFVLANASAPLSAVATTEVPADQPAGVLPVVRTTATVRPQVVAASRIGQSPPEALSDAPSATGSTAASPGRRGSPAGVTGASDAPPPSADAARTDTAASVRMLPNGFEPAPAAMPARPDMRTLQPRPAAAAAIPAAAVAAPVETTPPVQPAPAPQARAADAGDQSRAPAVAASTTGRDALPSSFSQALRTAADAGDPAAAHEVAVRFADGRGVPQNHAHAALWFGRAAEKGLAPAQYRLGSLYEKGTGVRRDLKEAHRLYRLAADQGNGKAMHNLAVLNAEGGLGNPDLATAASWFLKAARQGVTDSQYNLGILYARGIGVPQNLAESYKWFALAAAGGDADAGRKRDDVAARLDQQSLIAARLAVHTFKVQPEPEAANVVAAPAGGWDGPATAARRAGSQKRDMRPSSSTRSKRSDHRS